MGLVGFGQPDDGIIQMAYVVPICGRRSKAWVKKLGVGPWFLLEHFTGNDPKYRGRESTADVALAMSFAGHMNIELIQPNNERRRCIASGSSDVAMAFITGDAPPGISTRKSSATARPGTNWRFVAGVPTGGRVAYMDTTAELPGYVELIELGGGFEPAFSKFYRASIGWDGKDPVRSFI